MKTRSHLLPLVLALLSGLLAACSGEDPKGKLLSADEPEAKPPEEAEAARRSKIQAIHVLKDDGTTTEWDFNRFSDAILNSHVCSSCLIPENCGGNSCAAEAGNCRAELLLAAAGGSPAPMSLTLVELQPNGAYAEKRYTILPQSAATNFTLARWAFVEFAGALRAANTVLQSACSVQNLAYVNPDTNVSFAGKITSYFMNAYNGARSAADVAVKNAVAVSDAEVSSTPSLTLAQNRATYWRAAAATLLVKNSTIEFDSQVAGTPIPGLYGKGLCNAPELSAPAKTAMSVLREAGIAPGDVLAIPELLNQVPNQGSAAIAIGELLNSDAATPAGTPKPSAGSVKQRLETLKGVKISGTVEDYYGLKPADFAEARLQLGQEILAFSRSLTNDLGVLTSPAGAPSTYKRFAGTGGIAPERDREYYATLARTLADDQLGAIDTLPRTATDCRTNSNCALSYPATQSLAGLVDFAHFNAAKILSRQELASDAVLRESIFNQLGTLVSNEDSKGRLRYCWDSAGTSVDVFGFKPNDGLLLVRGEDGLECARTGSIEGARCQLTTASGLLVASVAESRSEGVFTGVGTNGSIANSSPPQLAMQKTYGSLPQRWYLVRLRQVGKANPGPGDYESVLGFAPQTVSTGPGCRHVPIVPDASEGVNRVLAPSRSWCTTYNESCAGTRFDDRLPLEDELTSDGDDIESSWKHYLALARQAAEESDLRGAEYLDSGLEADQEQQRLEDRAFEQLNELQTICGTAIDPKVLLAKLSDPEAGKLFSDNLGDVDLGSCNPPGNGWTQCAAQNATCAVAGTMDVAYGVDTRWIIRQVSGNTTCSDAVFGDPAPGFVKSCHARTSPPSGTMCVGGRMLRNPLALAENPELRRLGECVARMRANVEFVHLGDKPLCMWKTNGTNRICEASHPTLKCPYIRGSAACEAPAGSSVVEVKDQDTLKFFDTQANLPIPADQSLCEDIRALRKQPHQLDRMARIVASNAFNIGGLRDLRSRLRFEALYGGYVAVWVDGERRWATGDPVGGPESLKWPCAPDPNARCGDPNDGKTLFCTRKNCSTLAERAQANERLLGAVFAAQNTTWKTDFPPIPLTLPFYIEDDTQLKEVADRTTLTTQTFPIEVSRNAYWTKFFANATPATLHDPNLNNAPWRIAHTLGASATNPWKIHDPDKGWFALGSYTPAPGDQPIRSERYWDGMSSDGTPASGMITQLLRDGSILGLDNAVATNLLFKPLAPEYGLGMVQTSGGYSSTTEVFFQKRFNSDWKSYKRIEREELPLLGLLDVRRSLGRWAYFLTDAGAGPDGVPSAAYQDRFPVAHGLAKGGWPFTVQSMLDGLEMLCAVKAGGTGTCDQRPPPFKTLSDLSPMGDYMQCIGNEIMRRGATAVFPNLPVSAIDPLRKMANGPYETVGGSLGKELSELRSALIRVAELGPQIGRTMRSYGEDLKSFQHAIVLNDINTQIGKVEIEAKQFEASIACASSAFDLFQSGLLGLGSAVTGCAAGLGQLTFLDKLRDLGDDKRREERELIMADYARRFSDHAGNLDAQSLSLAESMEAVNRELGLIESLRQEARRSLNQALWTLSTKNQGPVTTVMQRRKETARIRYERAFDAAKKMAYLAKRAIEQRLGMRLSDLREDMPLVAAPQTWEGGLCATSGIDYDKLRQPGDSGPNNFADAFIGDYVTKLENVVESYRLRYNFHEGKDTAVVSLRDDVQNVRADCEVESGNLLYHASRLDHGFGTYSADRPGWFYRGCWAAEPNCVRVRDAGSLPGGGTLDQRAMPSYFVSFLPAYAPDFQRLGEPSLVQRLVLQPGRYRFSWFGDWPGGGPQIKDPAGNYVWWLPMSCPAYTEICPTCSTVYDCWINGDARTPTRYYIAFDVKEAGPFDIGWVNENDENIETWKMAGPMLESIDPIGPVGPPRPFVDTTDTRTDVRAVCEDTDGFEFRSTRWTRACVSLCPDGFTSNCGERAETHCYRETSFPVSQRAIESGQMFNQSGFARGNFNYRIQSIGVNFVGSGVRDCADASLPTTCHSAGYVPYTLVHEGPYFVRNHKGDDYRAQLFRGRIEHARGLATERYFTNPIGTSDQELIGQYLRTELKGRPLDGNFVLRVWEEPGVDFDSIQDVQLILNYSYWTRFD